MNNQDYELASQAIDAFRRGKYLTLHESCMAVGANVSIVNIMFGNESVVTQDEFVSEDTRINRIKICNECSDLSTIGNKTCNICVCPIEVITNMKFKECPKGKW